MRAHLRRVGAWLRGLAGPQCPECGEWLRGWRTLAEHRDVEHAGDPR